MTSTSRPGRSVDVFATVTHLKDNPYAGLWTAALQGAGALVHPLSLRDMARARRSRGRGWMNVQWPEWILNGAGHPLRRTLKFLTTVALGRCLGHELLLTVHNQRGHRGHHPVLEDLLWRALAAFATHVHTFTAAGGDTFVEHHPLARRAQRVVIPHGDYRPVVGTVPDRGVARAARGWSDEDEVVLVFGALRAYKGLSAVVDAVRADPSPRRRLSICGAPADEETRSYLEGLAGLDPRITITPTFLPQDELTTAIAAADVVVLPYRRITNSGSALLALSVGCPVVLPRTPVFEELQSHVGTTWVRLFDGGLTSADLEPPVVGRRTGQAPDLDWCSWDRIEDTLAHLFRDGCVPVDPPPSGPAVLDGAVSVRPARKTTTIQ